MTEEDTPRDSIHGIFQDMYAAKLEEPKWLIRDVLPVGLFMIVSPPKCMKTTMLMGMVNMVAGYKVGLFPSFMRQVDRFGPSIVFSYEATAGSLRYMCEKDLGIEGQPNESILIADDPFAFRLDDPGGTRKLMKWLEEIRPRLFAFDTLRDSHTVDENDSGEMNRLLRPFQRWAIENESAFVLVHHTKKRQDQSANYTEDDARGSSAIFGIVDGMWTITPPKREQRAFTIKATFKRAEGWEREVELGAFGYQSRERMREIDSDVLKLLRAGAPNVDSIADQLSFGKKAVVESLARLARNGYARKGEGDKWCYCP